MTVSSFDPDAPDPLVTGDVDPWDESWAGAEDVWVDPSDPFDPVGLDTPAARADWAYGRCLDPTTPTEVLERVVDDLVGWDTEALLAEARIDAGPEVPDPTPADAPQVVVLRHLVTHPNRPGDLATRLVTGWTDDTSRSPWPAAVALASDEHVDEQALVQAVTEACDAARGHGEPPAWAPVLVALAWGRADGAAVRDLLALVPYPDPEPARTWTDAARSTRGLPGGVRDAAEAGAEGLGWNGRRLPGIAEQVAAAKRVADRRRRRDDFADRVVLCPHGEGEAVVSVTPHAVTLPRVAAGPKPYVALIVGDHPVFRLKRDWPDRSDAHDGTVWTWDGPAVLESRDLGCDACRDDPDRGKRYFVSDGRAVAPVRLPGLQQVITGLGARADAGG